MNEKAQALLFMAYIPWWASVSFPYYVLHTVIDLLYLEHLLSSRTGLKSVLHILLSPNNNPMRRVSHFTVVGS